MRIDSSGPMAIGHSGLKTKSETSGDGERPGSASALEILTPDDRALIKAATGYVVSPEGVVTNAEPGGPDQPPVDPFIVDVASDRASGKLRGQITAPYLTNLFAASAQDRAGLNPSYLQGALDYLRARGRENRVDLSL